LVAARYMKQFANALPHAAVKSAAKNSLDQHTVKGLRPVRSWLFIEIRNPAA
jgi:hypothetical protein